MEISCFKHQFKVVTHLVEQQCRGLANIFSQLISLRCFSSYFRSQTKYQVVLTKTDTVFPIDVARRAMQIEEVNTFIYETYIVFFKLYLSGKIIRWHPSFFCFADSQRTQVHCPTSGMTFLY